MAKFTALVLPLLLLVLAIAHAVPQEEDGTVTAAAAHSVPLTEENFEKTTAGSEWILKYYTNWCGWCKKLKPIWEEMASDVSENVAGVKVGEIDCEHQNELCKKAGIRGFPSVIFKTSSGQMIEYEGNRSLEDLQEFVRNPRRGLTFEKQIRQHVAYWLKDFEPLWTFKKNVLAATFGAGAFFGALLMFVVGRVRGTSVTHTKLH